MSAKELLHRYLDECPLVAIIRGVTPGRGRSDRRCDLRRRHPDHRSAAQFARSAEEHRAAGARDSASAMLVGAGTVLEPTEVGAGEGRRRADHRLARHQHRRDRGHGGRRARLLARLFHAIRSLRRDSAPARPRSSSSRPKAPARRCSRRSSRSFRRTCRSSPSAGSSPTICGRGSMPARPASASAAASTSRASRAAETLEKARAYVAGLRPMKPIRIAIIGYGKIADDQHVPSIAANPRFELVATSSRSGQGVARDLHRLARADPQRRRAGGGGDHHAAGAALRDRARMHPRRASIACSKSRRPPASPRSPTSTASPRRRASPCSPPGTRSIIRPSTRRRKALAGKRIKSMRDPLARGRPQMAPGPAVDLGAGRLRRVRSRHQRLLDRDQDLPRRPVRPVGRAQRPGQCPDADRRRHHLLQPARPTGRSPPASTGAGPRARNGRSRSKPATGITVRLEDGGSRLILNGEPEQRRRPRRISRHLPHLRRPDRRAAQPRRRRAVPARRRLPARRPTGRVVEAVTCDGATCARRIITGPHS